jgi:hypothetical protein
MSLIAAFMMLAAAGGSFAPPEKLRQSELDVYFRCTANLNGDAARKLLAGALVDASEVRSLQVMDCYHPEWLGRRVSFGNYYFAGKLAEALIKKSRDTRAVNGARAQDVRKLPPLLISALDTDAAAERIAHTMDCVVQIAPQAAQTFVRAQGGKAGGAARAAMLQSASECPVSEPIDPLSDAEFRAATALSLYRVWMADGRKVTEAN